MIYDCMAATEDTERKDVTTAGKLHPIFYKNSEM